MQQNHLTVHYRGLSWKTLNSEEFRHVKLLLYWPIFGLLFLYMERFRPVRFYHVMHCALDNLIPFCEWFVLPYLFWFVYLIGMHLYTLRHDVPAFRRMMQFIMLTYSAALVIFFLFPSCQHLRPIRFERDNLLTRFMGLFYQFDTSTNVCPSLHVVGALAVLFASRDIPRFQTSGWRAAFDISAVLICISTVFLKQHSVIDVLVAVCICLVAYHVVYQNSLEPRRLFPVRRRYT